MNPQQSSPDVLQSTCPLCGKPIDWQRDTPIKKFWRNQMNLSYLWNDETGQDIAEYAVMLAVILIIVVGTVRLVGSNSNTIFSNVASSLQ